KKWLKWALSRELRSAWINLRGCLRRSWFRIEEWFPQISQKVLCYDSAISAQPFSLNAADFRRIKEHINQRVLRDLQIVSRRFSQKLLCYDSANSAQPFSLNAADFRRIKEHINQRVLLEKAYLSDYWIYFYFWLPKK